MFERWLEALQHGIAGIVGLRQARRSMATRAAVRVESLECRQLLSASGRQRRIPIAAEVAFAETQDSSESTSQSGDSRVERTAAILTPRILNGTPIDDDIFPAVGIVGDRRDPSGFGTGTLIASNWVLTAGHVSSGVGARAGRFILDGQTYETSRIFKHPKYRRLQLGTDRANDLALWKLKTPVVGITPNVINRIEPEVGEELTLVGFGSGGTAAGETGGFGTKRQGSTPIDGVTSTLITWEFDEPDESNTGHGDSGGPAFITRDGTDYLAGITSGGEKEDASLGDHSYDTRVDAFADWIDGKILGSNRAARVRQSDREPVQETQASATARSSESRTPKSRAFEPRIINGTPIPETTFPTVGKAHSQLGDCVATLIAPQWILTAGHCSNGIGNTDGTFTIGEQTYHSTQVVVHPKYNSSKLGTNAGNDIALWKLDQVVSDIAPSQILRKAPKVGQTLTLVGYGLGGDANGQTGQFGTKRQGTTRLDKVTGKLIRWNFDNPSESNTAGGDSGGPAFINVGGTYYVAGVTSGGTNANAGLGDKASDTRVDAYRKWIDATIG